MSLRESVTLSDTQVRTVEWALENEKRIGCGAIGHKPGLGKTAIALALTCSDSTQRDSNQKDLYVLPPSLLSQWKFETEKLTTLTCAIYGKNSDEQLQSILDTTVDIVLVSYYTLLYAEDTSLIFTTQWNRIIADEAHQIRNPETKVNKKMQLLQSAYRWVLSGTFLINSPQDMYGICKFLKCDGHSSKVAFERALRSGRLVKNILIQSNTQDLQSLQLKEKIVITETVVMTPDEEKIYRNIKLNARKQAMIQAAKKKSSGPQMLELINHLRVAACDVSLVPNTSLPESQKCGSKIKHLLKLVLDIRRQNPREKIIIFSNFLNVIEKYRYWLTTLKQKVLVYTGEVSRSERDAIVDAFVNDAQNRYPIMILGFKAGNAGINLQCATRVIFSEPFWNAAIEEQAEARAYRKGQSNPVYIYRLLTKNSIDERILKLANKKAKAIKRTLGNTLMSSSNSNTGITTSDMQDILEI